MNNKTDKKTNMSKVVLKDKKVTYVYTSTKDNNDKYSLSIMIPKDDTDTINQLKLGLEEVLKDSEVELNVQGFIDKKLRDGAKPNKKNQVNEETKDYYLLQAKRSTQPKVYIKEDVFSDEIIKVDSSSVNRLDVCDVIIYFREYNYMNQKGVTISLGDILIKEKNEDFENSNTIQSKFNL